MWGINYTEDTWFSIPLASLSGWCTGSFVPNVSLKISRVVPRLWNVSMRGNTCRHVVVLFVGDILRVCCSHAGEGRVLRTCTGNLINDEGEKAVICKTQMGLVFRQINFSWNTSIRVVRRLSPINKSGLYNSCFGEFRRSLTLHWPRDSKKLSPEYHSGD